MRAFEFLNEAPLPSDWDTKKFKPETSFDERLHYALQRAKKLGAGSSRVAMTIEYEGRPTALKIANSYKGIAQNEVEKDVLSSSFAKQSGLLIPLIDYDKENIRPLWIQVEQAEKASSLDLMNLIGCNLITLTKLAHLIITNQKDRVSQFLKALEEKGSTDQEIESVYKYATQLAQLTREFDMDIDDFETHYNWGIYKGRPVIIDVGANNEVISTYYR